MYVVAMDDPVVALRAAARAKRGTKLPVRIGRFLLDAWLRRVERQTARAVRDMEMRAQRREVRRSHPLTADLAGVLADLHRH